MELQVVSIRDRASGAYSRPVFVASIGQAVRSFQDECNRDAPDNEMFRHPDDFDLWHLGSFDDNSGRFENLKDQRQLALGKDVANAR